MRTPLKTHSTYTPNTANMSKKKGFDLHVVSTYTPDNKVCYEVHLLENLKVDLPDEKNPHVTRVGWSVDGSDYQLGEDKLSWGYGGTGKSAYENKFRDYGKPFGVGDVITCYIDLDATPKAIFYMVNGEYLGVAFRFTKELQNKAVYSHIATKNMKFKVNFGKEPPKYPLTSGFQMMQSLSAKDLVLPPPGPSKAEEAEVIMMVGLPASGKSFWCEKYAETHPEKKYYILGTNFIIDRMKVSNLSRKRNYHGRWEELIKRASGVLNKLFEVAKKRPKNYILDQTNVYFTARRRKMEAFRGYKRIAAVLVNKVEVLKMRTEKQRKAEGKIVPEEAIAEMKKNFTLPEVGPSFDDVWYLEELQESAQELVEKYHSVAVEHKKSVTKRPLPKTGGKTVSTPEEKKPRAEFQTPPNRPRAEFQTPPNRGLQPATESCAPSLMDIDTRNKFNPASQRDYPQRRKESRPTSHDQSSNGRDGRRENVRERSRDGRDSRPERRDDKDKDGFRRGDREREPYHRDDHSRDTFHKEDRRAPPRSERSVVRSGPSVSRSEDRLRENSDTRASRDVQKPYQRDRYPPRESQEPFRENHDQFSKGPEPQYMDGLNKRDHGSWDDKAAADLKDEKGAPYGRAGVSDRKWPDARNERTPTDFWNDKRNSNVRDERFSEMRDNRRRPDARDDEGGLAPRDDRPAYDKLVPESRSGPDNRDRPPYDDRVTYDDRTLHDSREPAYDNRASFDGRVPHGNRPFDSRASYDNRPPYDSKASHDNRASDLRSTPESRDDIRGNERRDYFDISSDNYPPSHASERYPPRTEEREPQPRHLDDVRSGRPRLAEERKSTEGAPGEYRGRNEMPRDAGRNLEPPHGREIDRFNRPQDPPGFADRNLGRAEAFSSPIPQRYDNNHPQDPPGFADRNPGRAEAFSSLIPPRYDDRPNHPQDPPGFADRNSGRAEAFSSLIPPKYDDRPIGASAYANIAPSRHNERPVVAERFNTESLRYSERPLGTDASIVPLDRGLSSDSRSERGKEFDKQPESVYDRPLLDPKLISGRPYDKPTRAAHYDDPNDLQLKNERGQHYVSVADQYRAPRDQPEPQYPDSDRFRRDPGAEQNYISTHQYERSPYRSRLDEGRPNEGRPNEGRPNEGRPNESRPNEQRYNQQSFEDMQERRDYPPFESPVANPVTGSRYDNPDRARGDDYGSRYREHESSERERYRPSGEPTYDIPGQPPRDSYSRPGQRDFDRPQSRPGEADYPSETNSRYDASSQYDRSTEASSVSYVYTSSASHPVNSRQDDRITSSYQTQMTTSTANYNYHHTDSQQQYSTDRGGRSNTVSDPVQSYNTMSSSEVQPQNPPQAPQAPVPGNDSQSYEQQQQDYQRAYSQWYANYAQAFAQLSQQK